MHNAGKVEVGLHAGELGLLEESLLKLCLEYSESLEETVLSERREESESLFWSSLRGILIHFSCYSKQAGKTNTLPVKQTLTIFLLICFSKVRYQSLYCELRTIVAFLKKEKGVTETI